MMDKKLEKIVAELSQLTVMESNELVSILEKHWNVSSTPMMAPAQASNEEKKEEKKNFDVYMTSSGNTKIAVIKAVKEICSLGLKEAKALVDKAPVMIKENVSKEIAQEIQNQLEKTGAAVELK